MFHEQQFELLFGRQTSSRSSRLESAYAARSAGLEACALAISRIACGSWDRAIVVAGEEAHPLIDTVLGHSIGKTVHSRAAAVALEQEMKARVQEMQAKVVEAQAQVPLAQAEAFRSGRLGIMDFYRMENVQADTQMRSSIAHPEGKK